MDSVTFKRIARDEWRVYHDGDIVADVCRQEDILREGEHYYVLHLSEDHRGPLRVHDRARVREVTERRILSHPLW